MLKWVHIIVWINIFLCHQIKCFSLENSEVYFSFSFDKLLTSCSKLELKNWKQRTLNYYQAWKTSNFPCCLEYSWCSFVFCTLFISKSLILSHFTDLLHDKMTVVTFQVKKWLVFYWLTDNSNYNSDEPRYFPVTWHCSFTLVSVSLCLWPQIWRQIFLICISHFQRFTELIFDSVSAILKLLKCPFHKFVNRVLNSIRLSRFGILVVTRTDHFVSLWTNLMFLIRFGVRNQLFSVIESA